MLSSPLLTRLHDQSQAARWGVDLDRFRAALEASAAHAFDDREPTASEVATYLSSLHLPDLALAIACAAGHEAAWDHFVLQYRPTLYRAADAIDPTGGARDLADSLYADLFGVQSGEGSRQSLFRYFHGRSSLNTWLRAVLAQRHVDRMRAGHRFEALPPDDAVASPRAQAPDPDRERFLAIMKAALAAALTALDARDRLRLGFYYSQDMTLAAIGRLIGEHEATVSRHLSRTRREIRQSVERHVKAVSGLDERAIAQCFETVLADPGALDLDVMLETAPASKKSGRDRSKM